MKPLKTSNIHTKPLYKKEDEKWSMNKKQTYRIVQRRSSSVPAWANSVWKPIQ